MAQIEMNALSVVTCGSITVRIFLPGMDSLALDDAAHEKKYPVLWLLHDEGESSVQFLATPAERLAEKHGIFIVCPDQHHAMCTNMKYGPRFEDFFVGELRGIVGNNLPISRDPKLNFCGGIGTGGYGALKMALKHPDSFAAAFSINGVTDMAKVVDRALKGEETGICQTKASLEAVFGGLENFAGGSEDLFALGSGVAGPLKSTIGEKLHLTLFCEKDSPYFPENEAFAQSFPAQAELIALEPGSDFGSAQVSLPAACDRGIGSCCHVYG